MRGLEGEMYMYLTRKQIIGYSWNKQVLEVIREGE